MSDFPIRIMGPKPSLVIPDATVGDVAAELDFYLRRTKEKHHFAYPSWSMYLEDIKRSQDGGIATLEAKVVYYEPVEGQRIWSRKESDDVPFEFCIKPGTGETIEIWVECRFPDAQNYVESTLIAVRQRWPDSIYRTLSGTDLPQLSNYQQLAVAEKRWEETVAPYPDIKDRPVSKAGVSPRPIDDGVPGPEGKHLLPETEGDDWESKLQNVPQMKQHYPHYDPTTAFDILKALPDRVSCMA